MTRDPRRHAPVIVLGLGLGFFAVALLRTAWLCDDAYIAFRTVDHVLHGRGLVWNTGERVQAFTEPMWMFLVAGATAAWGPKGGVYAASLALSIFVSMAMALVTITAAGRGAARPAVVFAGTSALLLGSRSLLDYSTSGLGNPLAHLLIALFCAWHFAQEEGPGHERFKDPTPPRRHGEHGEEKSEEKPGDEPGDERAQKPDVWPEGKTDKEPDDKRTLFLSSSPSFSPYSPCPPCLRGEIPSPLFSLFPLCLLAGLSSFNRLDGLLLLAPAVARELWLAHRRGGSTRRILASAFAGFAPLVLWLAFALFYFGFPFPNTAYAKLQTGIGTVELARQGLWYLVVSFRFDPLLLVVIFTAMLAGLTGPDGRARALAAGMLLHLLYVVRVGGDHMAGRFLTPPYVAALMLLPHTRLVRAWAPPTGPSSGNAHTSIGSASACADVPTSHPYGSADAPSGSPFGEAQESTLSMPSIPSTPSNSSTNPKPRGPSWFPNPSRRTLFSRASAGSSLHPASAGVNAGLRIRKRALAWLATSASALARKLSHRQGRIKFLLAVSLLAAVLGVAFGILSDPDYGTQGRVIALGHGVGDERAYYYPTTGLLSPHRRGPQIDHPWAAHGRALEESGSPLCIAPGMGMGFLGFHAGPGVHIIDDLALTDPLLARLPIRRDEPWRIGHFRRALPWGYEETLRTGRNQIGEPSLAALHEKLTLITRGPLLSMARLRAILELNLTRRSGLKPDSSNPIDNGEVD